MVSGYGQNDSSNFTTTDKLYLFSPHEIWNDVDENTSSGIDYYDKSYSNTRQLDYYASKSVTTSNYTSAIKKQNGSAYNWWLRSARSNDSYIFFAVHYYGSWINDISNNSYGVAPSFRIASGEKYRVTLNANGGSVTLKYIDVNEGNSVGELPTPTPEDEFHEFVGWYTSIDGGTKVDSSYVPEGNIEIFARWNLTHCSEFATDSWSTIKTNVNNDLGYYGVGCTKSVSLGSNLGTHTLRVANNTRPTECETSGFSQTACGFVIEFEDIITTHIMNPYDSSDTTTNGIYNKGGWEYSDMRAYVNSGKYLEGTANEKDYTSNGIYNALPSELKNVIIDTYVVSGHGENDSSNFTTTDKLYLFSTHEVYEDVDGNTSEGIDYYDKSYSNTRQLDYYASKSVTTNIYNHFDALKKLNGSAESWWLRSASSYYYRYFFDVGSGGGGWYDSNSSNSYGVSPGFRIASGE